MLRVHAEMLVKRENSVCGSSTRWAAASFESAKTPWNFEQRWHLFKYASNARTYFSPKIPEEFISKTTSPLK